MRSTNLLGSYLPSSAAGRERGEAAWPSPPWLLQSWEQSREFFSALSVEAEGVVGCPARSQLHIQIDWYGDALRRHLARLGERPVMRWFDETSGWHTLTWSELDAQSGALAALLAEHGTAAGDRVALVLPSGGPLLTGLLAVLRLAGCATPVLPLGSAYVRGMLQACQPKWVVTCSPYTALRGLLEYKPILWSRKLVPRSRELPASLSYAVDAPLLLVRSPLRPPDALTVVSAGDAYAAALRDGVLLLGLAPGETLLAPPTPQFLPATYLAALLCGAGIMELSAEAARREPGPLLAESTGVALLPQALCELLGESAAGPVPWRRWFRDPQEPLEPAAFERADRQLRLSSLPHANLIWDAAAGGAVLASVPRRGPLHPYVAPAPGCSHRLAAPHGEGPSLTTTGRFLLLDRAGKSLGSPGEAMLLDTGKGYVYAGAAAPRRAGWSYPVAAARAVLIEYAPAGLLGASAIEVTGGAHGQGMVVLILFVKSSAAASIDAKECVRLLVRELGAAAQPDRIEIFPLFPRRLGGVGPIDEAWVRAQYLSGELHRKSRAPVFQALTRLRAELHPLLTGLS